MLGLVGVGVLGRGWMGRSQVRMVLEDTGEALQEAGRHGCQLAPGSDTGVYVGCVSFEYATVLERAGAKVSPCPPACTPLRPPGARCYTGTCHKTPSTNRSRVHFSQDLLNTYCPQYNKPSIHIEKRTLYSI